MTTFKLAMHFYCIYSNLVLIVQNFVELLILSLIQYKLHWIVGYIIAFIFVDLLNRQSAGSLQHTPNTKRKTRKSSASELSFPN